MYNTTVLNKYYFVKYNLVKYYAFFIINYIIIIYNN